MPELEEQLSALASELEWPPTPALAAKVSLRVQAPTRVWYQSRWALAAAAVVIVLAALLAYPPSREAIAGWVNLHTGIQRVQHVPTPSPLPSGPLGKRLGLGEPTTLGAAQSHISWHIAVPSSLGQPDETYLQTPPLGQVQGEVTLVYSARLGIPVSGQTGVSVLVTEVRGKVDRNFFAKMLGPGTRLEEVNVNGHAGYWIAGEPHVFIFLDADGNFRDETTRLATNTLIFDNNGTIVRIEGNLTKDQALQIAASMG